MRSINSVNNLTPLNVGNRFSQSPAQQLYVEMNFEVAERRHAESSPINAPDARYPEIGCNPETQVCPGQLHGNILKRGGDPFAIAMQYPTPQTLGLVYELLAEKNKNCRVACMVVATDENKLLHNPGSFPPYFDPAWLETNQAALPGCKVSSTLKEAAQDADYKIYDLKVQFANDETAFNIPLIHIIWPDHGTINLSLLEGVIEKVNSFITEANSGRAAPKALPLIHCNAGVGRTAVIAAALRLIDPNDNCSVQEVIEELRRDRSAHMIQTPPQFDLVAELGEKHNKSLKNQ